MRPASRGTEEWHWSGSFRLSTREEYFGLRVRSKVNRDRAINVPVNCTVGPSGVPHPFYEACMVLCKRVNPGLANPLQ